MTAPALPALTPAQARELRAVAELPGCIRQGMLGLRWIRFGSDGMPVGTLAATIVRRLLAVGYAVAVSTPRDTTRARLDVTDAGRAWLDANPEAGA